MTSVDELLLGVEGPVPWPSEADRARAQLEVVPEPDE